MYWQSWWLRAPRLVRQVAGFFFVQPSKQAGNVLHLSPKKAGGEGFADMSPDIDVDGEQDDDGHDDIMYPSAVPFVLVHLACFAALWG